MIISKLLEQLNQGLPTHHTLEDHLEVAANFGNWELYEEIQAEIDKLNQ
jgi:hypothetical protein